MSNSAISLSYKASLRDLDTYNLLISITKNKLLEFTLFLSWVFWLQDLIVKPRYLMTFTVGYDQKDNIDAAVKKVY